MNKGNLTLKIYFNRSYSVLRKEECGPPIVQAVSVLELNGSSPVLVQSVFL